MVGDSRCVSHYLNYGYQSMYFSAIEPVLAILGGVWVIEVLDTKKTLCAIKISKAAGGIEVLNTLRAYKILKEDDNSKHFGLMVGR